MRNSFDFFKTGAVFLTTIVSFIFIGYFDYVHAQPVINDPSLMAEIVIEGLSSPTSMAFMDSNNILVLEKTGSVRLISNGILQEQPVLNVPVDTESERGLLGIATLEDDTVFLYFTESGETLRNRVYRYNWNGETLVNPTLILDLPAIPGPNHDYAIIGDLNHDGKLQNFLDGPEPDDTGVIFKVNPNDGSAAPNNPFVNSGDSVLSRYYAYGIRNSFGLAIDPLTNMLWDTENGPGEYDEVNLVRPGFNSGWQTVMGPISRSGESVDDLVSFQGSQYIDPVFSWQITPAVTDIEFLHSPKLGDKYANNIFVGDYNNGNIYYFEVNEDRTGIKFDASQTDLIDLVADNEEELSTIIFGSGFGSITDIATGPDGFFYILSFDDGIIYRIA
ncbi:MAG: putative quinoprotein glucose/sorbosone dehydrogenase (modular protein), partial [Nitrososphaeraceae archaeon]|nr:putative quinoprotein glucose/sorbosone dehydrogenase (modular protein) [Nitrososphaeraceae archaeon]